MDEKWILLICNFIQKWYDGNVDDAILNAPPGSGKSTITTRICSAWILGKHQDRRIYIFSASDEFMKDTETIVDTILKSETYKKIFPDFKIRYNNKQSKDTTKGGNITLKKSRSNITGGRPHYMFFDDFFNPAHIGRAEHQTTQSFLRMYLGRLTLNPQTKRIIIEQRIDKQDTTGLLSKQWSENKIEYLHLIFPFIFKEKTDYPILEYNISFKQNEFISRRFNEAYMNRRIAEQGQLVFETQYQQNPQERPEGALWTYKMIENTRNHIFSGVSINLVKNNLLRIVIGIDPAGGHKESNLTGLVVCGFNGLEYYVLEDKSGNYSPKEWLNILEYLCRKWHLNAPCEIIVEKNFGDVYLTQFLKESTYSFNFREVRAKLGKRTRAEPILLLYENNKVRHITHYENDQKNVNKLLALENEMLYWDGINNNKSSPDRMDAMVYALSELSSKKIDSKKDYSNMFI